MSGFAHELTSQVGLVIFEVFKFVYIKQLIQMKPNNERTNYGEHFIKYQIQTLTLCGHKAEVKLCYFRMSGR